MVTLSAPQRSKAVERPYKAMERAEIRYAVGECSLGSIIVAATNKGICFIALGDTPEVLKVELHGRFPVAEITDGQAYLSDVIALIEHPTAKFNLPLDVQGTTFQKLVWQALQRIPLGETRTYTQIAAEIGLPKSMRAVAQACGANKIAVLIPCHRVIRSDGSLSGYRWGVERKAELLRREKA